MDVRELHHWDVDVREASEIQRNLRGRLRLVPLESELSIVAGADVSHARSDRKILVAAVVLMTLPDLSVVEETIAYRRATFPYVPGYLSFREAPVLLDAFRKLSRVPDLVLFDGQGIAHPREFGLASHLGLMLDLPSVGCAKKRLVGDHGDVGRDAGSRMPLTVDGKPVGTVLRTRTGVKPVYVSPGNRIDIDGSGDAVMQCLAGFRLPEPIRRAHQLTQKARRERITIGEGAIASGRRGRR
jgi:deoxyribonuclease V